MRPETISLGVEGLRGWKMQRVWGRDVRGERRKGGGGQGEAEGGRWAWVRQEAERLELWELV